MPDLLAQHPNATLVFEDEMRYGTRTEAKKRWTRHAKRPQCPVHLGYEWGYLYVAIAPHTGELCAKYYSHFDNDCFKDFAQEMKLFFNRPILWVADRATPHQQKNCPDDVVYAPLPTATPELNPVERFFKELRKHIKGRCFQTIQQIEQAIDFYLIQYQQNPEKVINITKFHWL